MAEMTYQEFAQLPKHGSDTPSEILRLLEKKPMRTIEIAKKLNLKQKTVNYHLNKIHEKVAYRQKGKEVYWRLKNKSKE